MKILVTGMTSQHVNATTRAGRMTMSGVLQSALTTQGHDVEVRSYEMFEDRTFDKVFVGLGPLKGLGTAYMYRAMQALYDYKNDAVLFCDDTATSKIGREFKTILKRPSDYIKPFFMYKRDWEILVENESVRQQHMSMIDRLAGNQDKYWPLLVPSWTDDLSFACGALICQQAANNALSFDPSEYFAVKTKNDLLEKPVWGTLWDAASPAVNRMGVMRCPVENIADDLQRIGEMSGVLVPSAVWSPTISNSVSIGVPVASDWRVLGPALGEPFEALPSVIEMSSKESRTELAKKQHDAIQSKSSGSTVDVVKHALEIV